MFIDKNNLHRLKLKNTSLPLLLLCALPLKAIDYYCIYHINAPGCSTRATLLKDTSFKIVVDRSYSQQTIGRSFSSFSFKEIKTEQKAPTLEKEAPIKKEETPQKEETTKEKEETKEEKETKEEQKEPLRFGIGVGAFISKDAKSYSLPLGYYPKNGFFYTASLSYIQNDITDTSGTGDSIVGIGYNWTKHISTSIQAIIPTGDEIEGTGLGANGYILSQSFGFVSFIPVDFDISYSDYSKSKEYEIEYGSRYSANISTSIAITPNFIFDAKLSYYHSNSNKLDDEDLEDEVTFIDGIGGFSFSFLGIDIAKIGAVIPISKEFGDGIEEEEKQTSYYFSLNKLF